MRTALHQRQMWAGRWVRLVFCLRLLQINISSPSVKGRVVGMAGRWECFRLCWQRVGTGREAEEALEEDTWPASTWTLKLVLSVPSTTWCVQGCIQHSIDPTMLESERTPALRTMAAGRDLEIQSRRSHEEGKFASRYSRVKHSCREPLCYF